MASKSPSDDRRIRRARVRVAGGVAALLVALAGPGRFADTIFDRWQRLSPRPLTAMATQIVEIDPESLRAIGPWPWSRYDMARLTDRIAAAGPLAIGFDMMFPEIDRQTPALFASRYRELGGAARAQVLALPSFDTNFATALGAAPTVLGRAGLREAAAPDYAERSYADASKLPVDAGFDGALPAGVARWPQALASIPDIEETSLGHGLINGDSDADGVVRRVPAVGSLNGAANSGFAVELARIALHVATVKLVSAGGRLRAIGLGDHVVPTDADGRFRFRFGRVPGTSITSAADLFRRGFDPRGLAGKVVLVGVTGAGAADIAVTPLGPNIYGLHVQAQAVDAILTGGLLARPDRAALWETLAGLLLAALVIQILPRSRSPAAALGAPAAVAVAILAVSWWAFVSRGLLLDPLPPILIPAAAAFAIGVGTFADTVRAQRRLRAALLAERMRAARADGELDAARDIQRGMLPTVSALARLDPAIDIAALLEPARAVGGDFYDAFRLDDGRLGFLVGDVTGKGVPAALFMALSKALARTILTGAAHDPAAAFAALDAALLRDNGQEMFVTMLFGAIDTTTGEVALINAGHDNPVVLRADGRIEALPMRGGPPLCVATGFRYAAEPLRLGPGDGLIVTTDGVSEACCASGAFFERRRLIGAVAALARDWRAIDAVAAITQAVRQFEAGAEPSDDLTVLALRRSLSG